MPCVAARRSVPFLQVCATVLLLSGFLCAQIVDQVVPPALAPALARWQAAVRAGNAAALKSLYDPAARIQDPKKNPISLPDELGFWTAPRKNGLQSIQLEIAKVEPPQNGVQTLRFQAELRERTHSGPRTNYVVALQTWATGPSPRIVGEMRTPMLRLKQPLRLNAKLYDPDADAAAEIRDTEQRAAREHKRVLIVFGGNWCYDCHVLDLAFHSGDIEPTLDRYFRVVHVDVGNFDKNLILAKKYQVPLQKGVPAIAVVDPADTLLYSQQAGEFESARSLSPGQILAFLDKWKPPAHSR